MDALSKQMWQRASSSSSSASSLRTIGTQHINISNPGTIPHSSLMTTHQANNMGIRNVGILGIEKKLAEQHQRTHEHISEVFQF